MHRDFLGDPQNSSRIRDAGMAIESSGCEYVYISDDIGLWGGGAGAGLWGDVCWSPGGGCWLVTSE